MRDSSVVVTAVSSSSAEIHAAQMDLDPSMADNYYYVLQYKKSKELNYTEAHRVFHDNTHHGFNSSIHGFNSSIHGFNSSIHGLTPATEYVVRVMPYRSHLANALADVGMPTAEVSFVTLNSTIAGTVLCHYTVCSIVLLVIRTILLVQ